MCSAWSPDGKRLLCESGADESAVDDGIYTLRASDGGDLRRLTKAPAEHEDQPWGYSPDGTRILFVRASDAAPSVVFAMRLDGTGVIRLSPADLSASDFDSPAAWSPDGRQVAFAATPASVGLRSVYIVNADGSGLKEIAPADVGGIGVQWSPDGRWVAFTSRLCCQPQVWIVHPDGTGATQLTDGRDGSTALSPRWSPDGSKLVFQRVNGTRHSLWTMDPDGSGQAQIATAGTGFDVGSSWWLATSTGPRSACPFPDGGACLGPMTAGTHTSVAFATPTTFVVPDGWVNFEDLRGNLALLPPGGDIGGVDAGTSDALGIAANVAVDTPDCSGRPERGVGHSARAIAHALATRPGLSVAGPTSVTLGGLDGYVLDIRLAKGWTKMSCSGQPDVPLLVGVSPSDFADAVLGDIAIRMYLLDDGDRTIAVQIADVSGGGRLATYQAVVDGLRFGP